MRVKPFDLLIILCCICLVSCSSDPGPTGVESSGGASFARSASGNGRSNGSKLRIAYNPYANVNWSTSERFLAQTHDHTGDGMIQNYANTDYDVIPYGTYSSMPPPYLDYVWNELHWPPEDWLAPATMAAVEGKLLYPGPEHGYLNHITSMFLNTYIEGWNSGLGTPKESHHYETIEEGVSLINNFGGLAIHAHPTIPPTQGVAAQEIYNALFRIQYLDGIRSEDLNEDTFIPFWDQALSEGRHIWGVAVNDHYGPGTTPARPEVDSGETVVLAPTLSEQAVRTAFTEGSLFAVRDLGVTKGQFPHIASITVSRNKIIRITTTDTVRWISMGVEVATGNNFNVSALSESSRYVRAEIVNADGSVVYVQPFELN